MPHTHPATNWPSAWDPSRKRGYFGLLREDRWHVAHHCQGGTIPQWSPEPTLRSSSQGWARAPDQTPGQPWAHPPHPVSPSHPGTPSPDYPPLQTVRCRRPPAGQPRPPLVCPACFRAPAQGAGAGRPFPEPSAQAAALSRPPMQLTPEARQSETQGGTVTAGARAASSRCHHDPQLRLTQEESEARKEHGI